MVLLESKDLRLGEPCPDFSLPSVDEKHYSLSDFKHTKALLVAFICNHCPYVKAIESRLIALRRAFDEKDLSMVAICSNDSAAYPADSKPELFKRWQEKNYGFPYLIDADQNVAKSFDAVCTPDLFLFGNEKLFYHGQLDDNWQNESQVKHEYLKDAIKDILLEKAPQKDQKPSIGCSIKWSR